MIFDHAQYSMFHFATDESACLDIVHSTEILPYVPVSQLKMENKYFESWFQKDSRVWAAKSQFQMVTTRAEAENYFYYLC